MKRQHENQYDKNDGENNVNFYTNTIKFVTVHEAQRYKMSN